MKDGGREDAGGKSGRVTDLSLVVVGPSQYRRAKECEIIHLSMNRSADNR